MIATLEGKLIRTDLIDVAPEYERAPSLVEDDALRKSIETQGIQQPLILISKPDGRFNLIDGFRRLEIARFLDLKSIPAVVDTLPEGADPKDYQNRLRFVLDEHRQDLFPSQRAQLIRKMMEMFDMTQKQVATYLGVDPGSMTNWLAVERYAPEIVKAIDTGATDMHHARAFDGVKPEAQPRLFKSLKKEMANMSGGDFHKLVRNRFNPKSHGHLYIAPEKTLEKMGRKAKGRKSKRRPRLSRDEKKVLANSLEVQETELRDLKEERDQMKREINLATPPIRAILRSKELVGLLPEETKEEFGRFAEIYV